MNQNKKDTDEEIAVFKLLKEKYDWDFYESLTERGRKLVKDTINALRQVEAMDALNKYNALSRPDKVKEKIYNQAGKMTKEQILNKWLNKY